MPKLINVARVKIKLSDEDLKEIHMLSVIKVCNYLKEKGLEDDKGARQLMSELSESFSDYIEGFEFNI